jgi:hypothetical protein
MDHMTVNFNTMKDRWVTVLYYEYCETPVCHMTVNFRSMTDTVG